MSAAKPIPDGYYSVTPYLTFKNADTAIQFYKRAFGARELYRLSSPGGGVGHAEIQIGNSRLMMADESPMAGNKSPESIGGSPVSLMLYLDDVDDAFSHALKEGATEKRPVVDQFYGDRSGTLLDPFGYQWTLGTHKEDVSEEEMKTRMEKLYATQ